MAEISSPAEHLQSTLRRFYNNEVRDWFADIDLEQIDIRIPRQSMALACRHLDDDSFMMTVARQKLFSDLKERLSTQQQGTGETTFRASVRRRMKPQIKLGFLEDYNDVSDGYAPVAGSINIRLMDHSSDSINEVIAKTYATRIKSLFAAGGGFVWRKGKLMCSYSDWDKGYQLQLLCRNEAEGRRVVEQVLDIQSHSPEWEFFNVIENAEPTQSYPTVPAQERIYGQTRRAPRIRPIADVRFQYAELKVNGLPRGVILVDRSNVLAPALVT